MTARHVVISSPTARRGAIFIAAMWVLIALVGLVLVMTRWARVESKASGNRLAAAQAAMAVRAGEQYVLSQVAATAADATFAQQMVPQQVPVGDAYFWIVRPDRENDGVQDFGVDDEGSKVNINTASSATLQLLPGMTPDVADAIVDWRDADSTPSAYGAEQESYPNYRCKNAPFDTLEELLLVRGVTPDLLYGMDANHNGFLDAEELAAGGSSSAQNAANDTSRGLLPFLTVTGPGNAAAGAGGGQQVNVNGNPQPVVEVLRGSLDAKRFQEVSQRVDSGRPFRNMLDFYVKTQLKADEFALVADKLTVQGAGPNSARINVCTASEAVLRCLNGLDDSDIQKLVAARESGVDTTSLAWVADTIDKAKAVAIGDQITSRSYRFSADIVGVSGDGRAYQRVRVVVDASQTPPKVVYRRDLTDAGWSLDQSIRDDLRKGAGLTNSSSSVMAR